MNDTWTIYTDGGARGNPGPAAYAYVIKRPGVADIEGKAYLGKTTNNIAEYTGLVKALEHAQALGGKKIEQFGEALLRCINDYCGEHGVTTDVDATPVAAPELPQAKAMNATRSLAFQLFRDNAAIEDVIHQTGRSRATVTDYLADYIRQEKPASVDAWVTPVLYERIALAVKEHGGAKLKPIFIALEEKVSYDDIRVVVSHLSNQ